YLRLADQELDEALDLGALFAGSRGKLNTHAVSGMHDTHDAVGVKLQIRRPQAQINFGVARERRLGFYITSAQAQIGNLALGQGLGFGGCYVETESPFPRYTKIDLCLRAADL